MRFLWLISLMALTGRSVALTIKTERLHPEFNRVLDDDVDVDTIARGFTWTEGPLWLKDQRLLFAEITSNSIRAVSPDGAVRVLTQPSGYRGRSPYPGKEPGSSAMALDAMGRVTVAGHAGRAVWRFDDHPGAGHVTRLAETYRGQPLNSPNDLVYARDGSLYFTDPPFGLPTQSFDDPQRRQPVSGIYRLAHAASVPRGQAPQQSRLTLVSGALRGPNGLAFSPGERYLYVADTPGKRWVRFSVNKDGTLGPLEPFLVVKGDPRPGEPDGLKVDRLGTLFAAGPGGVWVISAKGVHLGTVPLPRRTSNLAWGGVDGRTLFVTASDVIYRFRVKTGR